MIVAFLAPVRQLQWRAGPSSFSELHKICKEDAAATELVPVANLSQLLLHPKAGNTPERLRFNQLAFRDLCGLVCPGLPAVIRELNRCKPSTDEPHQIKMLQIYNAVIKLLGDRIVGHRLVVDRRANVIVGVVGRSYRYVSNHELLQSAAGYFSNSTYVLTNATLWNRDLSMVCTQQKLVARSGEINFQQGLALYNSETTKRAIYAPRIVFDSGSGSYAMETEKITNKLIHKRKKKFAQQLDQLLLTAFRGDNLLPDVCRRHIELTKESLGSSANRPVVVASISSKLIRRQINSMPTERIANMLSQVKALSGWDLYTSLVAVASDFKSSERLLRTAAFEYLMKGKF